MHAITRRIAALVLPALLALSSLNGVANADEGEMPTISQSPCAAPDIKPRPAAACRARGWIITPRVALTPVRHDGLRRSQRHMLHICETPTSQGCMWDNAYADFHGPSSINLRGEIYPIRLRSAAYEAAQQ